MSNPAFVAIEEAVLGCAMNDASIVPQCGVSPIDFVLPHHRAAWDAILRLHGARESCDALTLAEKLYAEEAPPPNSGWLEYLAKLSRETAAPKNGPSYAAKLREHSTVRRMKQIGKQLADMDRADLLDNKIRELIELTKNARDHSCHIQQAMAEAIEQMDSGTTQISTGLKDLDACLGGLHDEDLIVVGARPATGKTAFLLNLALASTVPVGIISGEQGRAQIGMRCLAIGEQISLHKMRTGVLDDLEWSRVTTAINVAKSKNIWINDRPAPSIDDVVRQARAWKFEKNIGVLMVDYLQKLAGGNGESFRLQIGDIVSRLKDLGRELKIPVVVLAQVKREIESRPLDSDGLGRMPRAGDMAESGVIEQEADVIVTLYRPEVYSDLPQFKGVAYVNICKNRHGPIGHKKIAWRGEYLQFGDLAYTETQAAIGDRWAANT